MDSSIYINGVRLGDWKYGYSTFDWDITDHLREGENESCSPCRISGTQQ
ncbi:MAG: hypothetical protein V8Q05_05780 [Lachnospiraceae bacterium]